MRFVSTPKESHGPFLSSGGSWSLQFRLRCALELLTPGEPGKLMMILLWEWVLYTFLSLEAVHFLAKNDPPWARWTPKYSLRLSELPYPAALSPHSAPSQSTTHSPAYVSRRVMLTLFCRWRFRQKPRYLATLWRPPPMYGLHKHCEGARLIISNGQWKFCFQDWVDAFTQVFGIWVFKEKTKQPTRIYKMGYNP